MLLGTARFSGGRLIKTRLISCTSGTRERILQKRLARDEARRGEARRSKFIVLGLILSRKNKEATRTKRIVLQGERKRAREDGDKGGIYYYSSGRIIGAMKKLDKSFELHPNRIGLSSQKDHFLLKRFVTGHRLCPFFSKMGILILHTSEIIFSFL